MPPNSEEPIYLGTVGFKIPLTEAPTKQITGHQWLDARKRNDGAEGLWRIHDDLYDLTTFIKRHPGGSEWLEMTKGMDITEAFETHHLYGVAENMLAKFHVRKAEAPRFSPFTFEEDGFYRTLKRRVAAVLKGLPKKGTSRSALYTDMLLFLVFAVSILACRLRSCVLGALAGVFLGCVTIAAHNYFHRRDNVRMYYFNFSLMSYREWRISHVLSHHLFTNTIIDLEMLIFEPLIEYFPKTTKKMIVKYLSWVYAPIFWTFLFHTSAIKGIISFLQSCDARIFSKADLIPFLLPLAMYILGGQSFLTTVALWTFIVMCGSLHFGFVGFNAAHHHPEIFHDGDTPRKEKDWGMAQLDSVVDRHEITGSHYLVLTNFGDHGLHHMFPTLDHGVLDELYPIFKDTMKEFNVDLRMTSQAEMIRGQFRQLSRNEPNPNPPNLFKFKKVK